MRRTFPYDVTDYPQRSFQWSAYQNAASVVAGEFVGAAGQGMLRAHVAAIVLILAAIAVLLLVALPALGYAGAIGALVFAGGALGRLLLAVLLVAPVAAVVVAVTAKAIEYALSTGPAGTAQSAAALELALRTAVDDGRALQLIGVVITIAFAITAKGQRDAVAIVAGEVLVGAATAIAVRLVRVILAIVFAIADPLPRNAEAVLALKLILGAIGAGAAVRLIGVVAAVVVAIAQPVLVDAAIGLGAHHMQAALLALLLQLGHHVVHVVAVVLVAGIRALHLAIAAAVRLDALAIAALPLRLLAGVVAASGRRCAVAIAGLAQLPRIIVDHNPVGEWPESLLLVAGPGHESVATSSARLSVRFAHHIHVATPTLCAHITKFRSITRAGSASAGRNARLVRYHWLLNINMTVHLTAISIVL